MVVAALLAPAAAHAQYEIQALLNTSGGYTDNAGGNEDAVASPFFTLQPGFAVVWGRPRTVHRVGYVFSANVFTEASEFNSFSNQMSYGVAHAVDPRTDLLIEVSASHQQANTAGLDVAPGTGQATATIGSAEYLGLQAGEGLQKELSPRWRFVQGFAFTLFTPADFSSGLALSPTMVLGVERAFESDTLGAEWSTGLNYVEQGDSDQALVLNKATLRWGHELWRDWRSEVSVGAMLVTETEDQKSELEPIGGAWLGYEVERGAAGVYYSRGATLNPYIGQNLIVDDVGVRARLPLARDKIALGANAGVQRGHTLIAVEDPAFPDYTVVVVYVDVGLGWKIRENIELGARYQFMDQNAPDDLMGAPPDMRRNVFLVTLSAKYPEEQRTRLPFRRPLRMERTADDELDQKRPIRK